MHSSSALSSRQYHDTVGWTMGKISST